MAQTTRKLLKMTINTLLPDEFLAEISHDMPSHLNLDELISACHKPLRFSIRVNTLNISVEQFIALITTFGWKCQAIPWCESGFWIDLPAQQSTPGNLPEHLTGLFYVQEASSMLPPVALFDSQQSAPDQRFDKVLDLAAAPGSKTTQIAALMANRGVLVANEYSSSRIKALHSNLVRMGISNTIISHFDGQVHGDYLENTFDAVLIDAPCSGEGTVRKDPDAFKNWSSAHISNISEVQRRLIRSAFMALKPGGELVYSTCALNFTENQAVCQSLLEEFEDSIEVINLSGLFDGADKSTTPQGYLHIWPQIYDSEGFFVAKFKKLAATNLASPGVFKNRFPFRAFNKTDGEKMLTQLNALGLFGIEPHNLYRREQEVWFFPTGTAQLISKMKFQRLGVKLLDIKGKNILIDHHAARLFSRPDIELTREQLVEYIKGRDIARDNKSASKGQVFVGYQDKTIGMAKWVGNKLKNKLPRTLVNDHVNL